MGNQNSTTPSNFSSGQTTQQPAATSKDATERLRAHTSMVQNVLLIWLDNNIDEDSDDCQNTLAQLRRIINVVNTFTDSDECIEFITKTNNEKICMIISGALGQLITPSVHNMSQVDSIFIFCANRKQHEQWAKEWSKIKGVYTEISSLCKAMKGAVQQCEHNTVGMSFMPISSEASNTASDKLDYSFMYTQIIKEIVLTISFEQQHIKEFIKYCDEKFTGNAAELKNIRILEGEYREKTPIWWYTLQSFLYPMVNHALRTMDVNIIIMMGFFITDLHRDIERLHTEQFGAHPQSQVLTVYRGQGLSKIDFEQLMKTKDGLMSFNSFLSTSKKRNVSLDFARKVIANPDMVGILFVMTIDPSLSSTPFASVTGVSSFQEVEDEVLFSMHTVFRIREIKSLEKNNRLWQVKLTLTSDDDKDLRVLTERIREETEGSNGWSRLGRLLLKMGQSEKAQQVYEVMLQQTSDESEKAVIYHMIGSAKDDQGQYEEAITFYQQSLKIYEKTLAPTHPNLAAFYSCIGVAYQEMGEYLKALSSHEKGLEIYQKTLPPTHPNLASSHNNIGNVYLKMGEYSKALSSHEKALEFRQKDLPPTHPDLAASYTNIGIAYYNMDEYSKAISSYEKALEIQKKTLPSTHSNLASSYNNMGNVYLRMGDYPKALSYYEETLEIRQKTLSSTHAGLALSNYNIGNVYYKMGEYSKALPFCERAVDIAQQSLPMDHPHNQLYQNNLDLVKKKL